MSEARELAARYFAEIDDRFNIERDAVRDRAARARDGVAHGAFALRDRLDALAPQADSRPDPFAYVNPLDAAPTDDAFAYEPIPDTPLAEATDMYHSTYDASDDVSAAFDGEGIPVWRDP